MPIHVSWDDEAHTIIRNEGYGEWTWEEYHQAVLEAVKMMQTVSHRVDIINMRQPGSQVPSGSPMPHIQKALQLMPPHYGVTVLVSNLPSVKAVAMAFMAVYQKNRPIGIFFAETLEEAHDLIKIVRQLDADAKSDSHPETETQEVLKPSLGDTDTLTEAVNATDATAQQQHTHQAGADPGSANV